MFKWMGSLSFEFRLRLGRLVIVVRLKPGSTAETQEATEGAWLRKAGE
jgi:hypothetical protein